MSVNIIFDKIISMDLYKLCNYIYRKVVTVKSGKCDVLQYGCSLYNWTTICYNKNGCNKFECDNVEDLFYEKMKILNEGILL